MDLIEGFLGLVAVIAFLAGVGRIGELAGGIRKARARSLKQTECCDKRNGSDHVQTCRDGLLGSIGRGR